MSDAIPQGAIKDAQVWFGKDGDDVRVVRSTNANADQAYDHIPPMVLPCGQSSDGEVRPFAVDENGNLDMGV